MRDRHSPNFAKAVKSEFRFLESDYGMTRSHPIPTAVDYASPIVQVIVHSSMTMPVIVHLILSDIRGSVVNRAILLNDRSWDVKGLLIVGESGATNHEPIEEFVAEAANNLRLVGRDLLTGDPLAFNQINQSDRSRAAHEWLERHLQVLKRGLNFTWKEKNFLVLLQLWDELQLLKVTNVEKSYELKARYAKRKLTESKSPSS